MRHLANSALGVTVQEQVGSAVHKYRATNFFAPIVVVRDATKACFDSAYHDGRLFISFSYALAVHDNRSIGAMVRFAIGGIGVIVAPFSVCGVAIDHGVHVARRHAEKQSGLSKAFEILAIMPIRLSNDANPKALRFEHAAYHSHAKTGVIYVGVARHDDDVTRIPAQLVHFGPRCRKKGGWSEAFGPVFWMVKQSGRHNVTSF